MPRSCGQLYGERARRPDADEHRRPGDGRLLNELERESSAHTQHALAERQQTVEQRPTDDLVHRVVPADVFAAVDQPAIGGEQARGVKAAGTFEPRLVKTFGKARHELAAQHWSRGKRRAVDGDLLERALAADAAR